MTTRDGINIVLKIVGIAGLAGLIIVAPNSLVALDRLLKKKHIKQADHKRILAELKRQGLVYIKQEDREVHYTLSIKGAKRLQQITIDELTIPRPKKWDKKWRLVAFDIPVKHSRQRAAFVTHLHRLNFMMVQKSLWVYPVPCFDQVEQLAEHYGVARFCSLLEVGRLDESTTKKLLQNFSDFVRV